MKEIYEMHGRGHSARTIARELGLEPILKMGETRESSE